MKRIIILINCIFVLNFISIAQFPLFNYSYDQTITQTKSNTSTHVNTQTSSNFANDQVIIQFHANVTPSQMNNILNQHNLVIIDGPTPVQNFYLAESTVQLAGTETNNNTSPINGVITGLSSSNNSSVNSIGINYRTDDNISISKSEETNPNGSPLAGCNSSVYSINTNIGDYFIKCGVFDTGVSYSSEFDGYFNETNFGVSFCEDESIYPVDINGHGTHMISSILLDNPHLLIDVLELHAYQTHCLGLNNGVGSVWNLIQAIDESILEGVNIVNISSSFSSTYNHRNDVKAPLKVAIEGARDIAGMLFITAAGNSGSDNDNLESKSSYPASYLSDNIIAVAAVDCDYLKPSWSNWGGTSVDLAAPGVDIWGLDGEGGYTLLSGTSSACALVTRVANQLATSQSVFDFEEIKCAILNGAIQRMNLVNRVFSNGYLDANGAYAILSSGDPCSQNIITNPNNRLAEEASSNTEVKNGLLYIESDKEQKATVSVFNTFGQRLSSEIVRLNEGETSYDWNKFDQELFGVYFIHLKYENRQEVIKVFNH